MTSLRLLERYMRTLYGLMTMVCIRSWDNYVTATSCPTSSGWQMATSGVKDLCRMVLLQWLQHRRLVSLRAPYSATSPVHTGLNVVIMRILQSDHSRSQDRRLGRVRSTGVLLPSGVQFRGGTTASRDTLMSILMSRFCVHFYIDTKTVRTEKFVG